MLQGEIYEFIAETTKYHSRPIVSYSIITVITNQMLKDANSNLTHTLLVWHPKSQVMAARHIPVFPYMK